MRKITALTVVAAAFLAAAPAAPAKHHRFHGHGFVSTNPDAPAVGGTVIPSG